MAQIQTGTTHVWRIQPDGSGDAPTVQAGIDSAANGDLVLVEPGTYYENINLRGKAIHLKGDAGPEVTILDGTYGDSSVVVCDSGETNRTTIEGLTITHGKGTVLSGNGRNGGGILCMNAAPIIRDSKICGNRAVSPPGGNMSWGGALLGYSLAGTLILEDNVIENNFATSNGGGVVPGRCIIRRNTFRGNTTERGDGGGLRISGEATIEDNLFIGNIAADHGGAIYIINDRSTPSEIDVVGNVFVANEALGVAGAADCSGGAVWVVGGAHIRLNTIAFNYSLGSDLEGGGICLFNPTKAAILDRNILFKNANGGLVVHAQPGSWTVNIMRNLLYANEYQDICNRSPDFVSMSLEGNLSEDPLFCVSDSSSRGELAGTSPALNQPYGVIGAVSEPGCGPYPGTWGSIQRLMKSEIGGKP